jgi:hypothetical protein
LDDGSTRLAIVIVDSCMIPRELCDRAKELASNSTGIRTDRILISATHTHSAPSVMDFCLGSRADPYYTDYLSARLAASIEKAAGNLVPARAGWAVVDAGEFTKCRRWITRPDRMLIDPFGQQTVRAMMHPGHLSPDYVGPSGPADPWLSILSIQSDDGTPLALLANFSMHYFSGHGGVSADYFGRFTSRLTDKIAPDDRGFVGIMSQGTSGDLWWGDYSVPQRSREIDEFTDGLVALAVKAYRNVDHCDEVSLSMAETRLTLERRTPDNERLSWAREMLAAMGDRRPRDRPEVYAEQAVYLHENPETEIVLQAIRIGQLGITAIPNEVYGITGLKLKARSPLRVTFNVELANGADGYIPPPEQHLLGGYTTWPARTAGLEVEAEPKIVESLLRLLEEVSGQPRQDVAEANGPYPTAVFAAKPVAYWRMAELNGSTARDASGHGNDAAYEGSLAYYLPGPQSDAFSDKDVNRAVHFAGGGMTARVGGLTDTYSVEFWFWNAIPNDIREIAGTLFFHRGDPLEIDGTRGPNAGRLVWGDLIGETVIAPRTWNHIAVVRDVASIQVYLNGAERPDLFGVARSTSRDTNELIFAGSSRDNTSFEGKIDEVSVYDRLLSQDEINGRYRIAEMSRDTRD